MAKLNALLVGAGGMGQAWAKNLAAFDEVRLAGWIDIRPKAAADAAEKLQINDVRTSDNLQTMLRAGGWDFVVDVTIPEAHHDVTIESLKAGLPVIGEKPMADTMDRARAMVRASETAGKLYMVSQSRRYDARQQSFIDLIRTNVGALGILNSDFYLGAHFGGFRDEMPSPLLLDMAIHTFDSARFISGADPVSVYCEEFNPPWSWYKGNACATAIFEMTGGLRYTYRGSWCSDGRHTSWQSDWRAVGPRGSATWDGQDEVLADEVVEQSGFQRKTTPHIGAAPPANFAAGIAGSLRDFVRALKTGSTPLGECHDNIKSLAMVFAAIESAHAGRRIDVRI